MFTWNPNPFLLFAIPVGLTVAFGLFRFRFGRDTLQLALELSAIMLSTSLLVTYLRRQDVVATLTFSYPASNAALAFPIAVGYAFLLWAALCAAVLSLRRIFLVLRGSVEERD